MTSRRTRERLLQRLYDQGITDIKVLEVMRSTPRHLFVDEALAHRAYEDAALPIGFNQTLSRPYVVARMTEILLAAGPLGKVLEVGTGSGYQTAVLAQLAERVYTVERIRPLLQRARQRLSQLKCYNVRFRHADGGLGWPAEGPFDAILSAAAPREVPPELAVQLAPGGRLVMPIGDERHQELVLVTHTEKGYEKRVIEPVRFVPFLNGIVG